MKIILQMIVIRKERKSDPVQYFGLLRPSTTLLCVISRDDYQLYQPRYHFNIELFSLSWADSTDPKINLTSISNTDCLIFTSFTFFVKLYFDMNRQSDFFSIQERALLPWPSDNIISDALLLCNTYLNHMSLRRGMKRILFLASSSLDWAKYFAVRERQW